jgi:NADH-quinone oxidoreductase subunit C
MTTKEISEKLKEKFSDAILDVKVEGVLEPFVRVSPDRWIEIAQFLRDDDNLKFDYLTCITSIDSGKGTTLSAIYNVTSVPKHHKIAIKIEVPKEKAEIPSVSSVWPAANWHEREAYDLMGITFLGHPDLRRILLPDDWEGHPLRKDYKTPDTYHGMKVPY